MFCKGKSIDVIAALLVTDLLTNYFTKKWADLYRPINFLFLRPFTGARWSA